MQACQCTEAKRAQAGLQPASGWACRHCHRPLCCPCPCLRPPRQVHRNGDPPLRPQVGPGTPGPVGAPRPAAALLFDVRARAAAAGCRGGWLGWPVKVQPAGGDRVRQARTACARCPGCTVGRAHGMPLPPSRPFPRSVHTCASWVSLLPTKIWWDYYWLHTAVLGAILLLSAWWVLCARRAQADGAGLARGRAVEPEEQRRRWRHIKMLCAVGAHSLQCPSHSTPLLQERRHLVLPRVCQEAAGGAGGAQGSGPRRRGAAAGGRQEGGVRGGLRGILPASRRFRDTIPSLGVQLVLSLG